MPITRNTWCFHFSVCVCFFFIHIASKNKKRVCTRFARIARDNAFCLSKNPRNYKNCHYEQNMPSKKTSGFPDSSGFINITVVVAASKSALQHSNDGRPHINVRWDSKDVVNYRFHCQNRIKETWYRSFLNSLWGQFF